jgi:hypothetical protein
MENNEIRALLFLETNSDLKKKHCSQIEGLYCQPSEENCAQVQSNSVITNSMGP